MPQPKPQLFFMEGSFSELRAVSKKYPVLRELCKKTSPLRAMHILPLFTYVAGYPELAPQAEKVWQKALIQKRLQDTVKYAAEILGCGHTEMPKDSRLPEAGLSFGICPDVGGTTAMILVDKLRILRWCQDSAVPTFTIRRAPERFVVTCEDT